MSMPTLALGQVKINSAIFKIEGYKAKAKIGCADEEEGILQGVVIDLELRAFPEADLLNDTKQMPYDYLHGIQAIEESLSLGHHILQEALAKEIALRALAHPRIASVRVKTMKTERYAGTDGVSFVLDLAKAEQR